MSRKMCPDCRYYGGMSDQYQLYGRCHHESARRDGELLPEFCWKQRSNPALCGSDAVFFEPGASPDQRPGAAAMQELPATP